MIETKDGDVPWSSGPVGIDDSRELWRRLNYQFVVRPQGEITKTKDRSADACSRRGWRGLKGTRYIPRHVRAIPLWVTILDFEEELKGPETFAIDNVIKNLNLGGNGSYTSVSPGWEDTPGWLKLIPR